MNKLLILIAVLFALLFAINANAQPVVYYPYDGYDYICYKVALPYPHTKCEYRRVYDYRYIPPRHHVRPLPPPPPGHRHGHHPPPPPNRGHRR